MSQLFGDTQNSPDRPSRLFGVVFVVVALLATAFVWGGLSLKDVLAVLRF